jgi:hypothetical protein
MDFFRNRFLIDYCQHVIYNLLYRTDGAPFIGEGEKYFSIIDDTEIEIMKCIWEHPDTYIKIPPARRVWNMEIPELGEKTFSIDNPSYYAPDHSYKNTFIHLTLKTLAALDELEKIKSQSSTLVFNRLERGVFCMLAIQMKDWKNIYFMNGFKKSFDAILTYLAKFPQYDHYLKSMFFLDTKDDTCYLKDVESPCIVICNENSTSATKILNKRELDLVISYNGRL